MSAPNHLDRRGFLQAGAVTAAAVAAGPSISRAATARQDALPTRKLGKTGVELTILDQGTWRAPGLDRLLRASYSQGVRVYDTAKAYGSEPGIGRWLEQMPEVRKEIFLVTKDSPRTPSEMTAMLDQRLADLKTDYVDLFFIHALGDHHSLDDAVKMATSKEFKETADAIRKSGKARFIGFSTHHKDRPTIIAEAAKAGFVDAIMLQFTPWLAKDDPLNKALDLAFEKGIGLISMKQVAGNFGPNEGPLATAQERVPMLKEKGFSPYQGLLQAIWSDERITATCVSMRNTDQIRENVAAARDFGATGPLKLSQIEQLRDAAIAHGKTLCADCDGRCGLAAGTTASLGDLTRFLTYHEFHGYRSEARRLYRELPENLRNWQGADLAAARDACPNRLDFAKLLPKVDELLG